MDVLFLISVFRLYPGLKMSFEHISVRKNLFLSACFCWDFGLSLREMDQNFKLGGLIGYGNFFWTLYFVTPKNSDCMQYFMMLLELCEHIVTKDLATAT